MTDSIDNRISRRSLLRGAGAAIAAGGAAAILPSLGVAPAFADDSWDAVVAAAEKEGAVNIQGPVNDKYRASIQTFSAAYPKITLNYTSTSGDDFEARYTAERRAGQYLNDFFIGGVSGTVFTEQVPGGWYDPLLPLLTQPDVIDDSKWLGGFKAGFLDSDGTHIYTVEADQQNNINIDRGQISEADFSDLSQIFDPKWKGKIASLDPRLHGDQMLTLVYYLFGEDKLRALLTEQDIALTRDRRQLQEWAVRGAYPITLGVSPSELLQYQTQGIGQSVKRLQLKPEQTPWSPGWGAIALLHNVPHPNAAKVFANWFLSQSAQADWASRGLVNSRRTDVAQGLPTSAVSEQAFLNGLTFNSAKLADVPGKAFAFGAQVLGG